MAFNGRESVAILGLLKRALIDHFEQRITTYIAPDYMQTGNVSLRLWVDVRTSEYRSDISIDNKNGVVISFYNIMSNPKERIFTEILNQVDEIFNIINSEAFTLDLGESKNIDDEVRALNGSIERIDFNPDLTEAESVIEGLYVTRLYYSCEVNSLLS